MSNNKLLTKPYTQTRFRTNEKSLKESHIRTLLKTLSWRIIATATTVTIAYIIFGNISSALKVGGIEFFAKMLIYYCHERAWQIRPRGRVRNWLRRKNA
ncbi:DUF2061 domain-containing protein [filamentous cyanobacterium LEGE 11480]|uniref:DUF2061 domain-containing protein n=2 Tax=Romeriopsis TaxID=2992131 RepID=A0A928VR29_9CYAN|nr:DUF2061 domain-containing protein [Romeriopsis navalis LEGE 11480]